MKVDNDLFEIAAQEVSNHVVIKGIMARAFSDALGDKDKSVALYIKYRVANLKEEQKVFLERKNEEEKNARIKQQKEEDAREREAAYDRERMKFGLITICKECGYAGSMQSSFIPPSDHGFGAATCKCPKCSHRFDWYYIPSKDLPKAQT
jgi:hypothetical protein